MARNVGAPNRLKPFNLVLGIAVFVCILILVSNSWSVFNETTKWIEQSSSENEKAERIREVGSGAKNFIIGVVGLMICLVAFLTRRVILDRRREADVPNPSRKERKEQLRKDKLKQAVVEAKTPPPISTPAIINPNTNADEMASLRAEVVSLQRSLAGEQRRAGDLKRDLDRANGDRNRLNGQLEAERNRKDDLAPGLRRELAAVKKEAAANLEDALKRQQEHHDRVLEKVSNELAVSRAAVITAEGELHAAKQRISELGQLLRDSEGRLQSVKEKNDVFFHQRNDNLKQLYEMVLGVNYLLDPLRRTIAPHVELPEVLRDPRLLKQLSSFHRAFAEITDAVMLRLREQDGLSEKFQRLQSETARQIGELNDKLRSVQAQLESRLALAEAHQASEATIKEVKEFVLEAVSLALLISITPKDWTDPETNRVHEIKVEQFRDAADTRLCDLLNRVPAVFGDLLVDVEESHDRFVRELLEETEKSVILQLRTA